MNNEAKIADKINQANDIVIDILQKNDPYWVGVRPAIECVPDMREGLILHSGPEIEWDEMSETQRRGGINGVLFEGYAKTREDAEHLLKTGEITFASGNDYHIVVPGSGIATPSMVMNIVEDRNSGVRGFCAPFEGPNRGGLAGWGVYNEAIDKHLHNMSDVIGPAITRMLEEAGGMALKRIMVRGVEMGDELHSRQDACGLILTNELAKMIFDTKSMNGDEKRQVMDLIFGTVRFFHPLGMASAMSGLEAARHVPYSTVVTAMEGNGVTYGIKVAGLGNQWFTAPAPRLEGEYVAADIPGSATAVCWKHADLAVPPQQLPRPSCAARDSAGWTALREAVSRKRSPWHVMSLILSLPLTIRARPSESTSGRCCARVSSL